jgi:menaquinone-9 beta-reductase
LPSSIDVLVIGGGPAGLAMAIAARQHGLTVAVADGMRPPIDKACGEGLMPDGLAALERLGLQLPLAEAYPFRGIRFLSRRLSTDALFPAGGFGWGARRTVLHRTMTERAAQVGAELLWGRVVTAIREDGVRLGRDFVRARWIVGADGSNSRVRRWAGLEASYRPRLRYAFRSHYHLPPWSDHMEMHWGERCQGYATPVSGEQVCVVIASGDPRLRLEEGLEDLPWLRERLENAETVTTERGAITGNRRLKRVCRGNVVVIGDAAGTVDAITGEGLRLAFSQATALAECMAAGDLSPYQQIHDRLTFGPRLMARLMLMLDGRPRLQGRTLEVFEKHPEIFRRLLALHVGALPPRELVWEGLTLGWRLITA